MPDFFPPVWNGTLREHYLLLFSVAGGIALAAGLIGAWLGAHFGSRRVVKEVLDALPNPHPHELANHLGRLSVAVDTMAVEIERLSEGQRFAAKLLAERGATPPAQSRADRTPGVTTPH